MSKKCVEYGTSANGNSRCKRYEQAEDADVAVAKSGDESLGYFDIKEVSAALRGLKDIGASDIIPPLIGSATTLLATLLIRKFVTDENSMIRKFAPVGGVLGGVLVSIPLYWAWGKKAVITSAVSGLITGGVLLGWDRLKEVPFFKGTGLLNVQTMSRGQHRMGEAVASPVRRLGAAVQVQPTARVPGGIVSAMDIPAFAGKASY